MRCFTKVLAASFCLFVASLSGAPTASAADTARDASIKAAAAERFGDLPLSFEANQGQADHQVQFVSRGSGYSFFLTRSGAVLSFSPDATGATVLQMQLAGANPDARIHGLNQLPGTNNYFFGSDSRQWRTGVPTFAKVEYENVYPGVNLVYYGNQKQLEYDFVLSPGADPQQIRLSVSGAQKLSVDAQGNLVLSSAAGDVQLLAPRVYQQIDGASHGVSGQWTLAADNTAGFRLGHYDRAQPLVIDPVMMYSSFLGGSQKNTLNRIAIDADGSAYVAGYTSSGDFPAAPTPQSMTFGTGSHSRGAFIAKIDSTGSNLVYSTYLSGSADEEATGIAIDKSGNVFVAGTTHSTDFPTMNALQSACGTKSGNCSSAFLAKIGSTGNALLFSTYLGGSGTESARSVAVDSKGNAYLAGITTSIDFPATPGAFQTKCGGSCQQNAFVAKFTPDGGRLAYATYLGGSGSDDAADLAVDASGNVFLAGRTTSRDFPVTSAFQKKCAADAANSGACLSTAFVTKIKAAGSGLAYSTYLGGSLGSKANAIAIDSLGSAYVVGSTQSSDFPTLKPYQKSCGLTASKSCSLDAFLTKLASNGKSLVYSTYLGGAGDDEASGVVLDANSTAFVVGRTESSNFPTAASIQSKLKGASDAFVARFSAGGDKLAFSTYHGGTAVESGKAIALDNAGNIYLAGETSSSDFPTRHAFQTSCAGTCASAFVTKMSLPPAGTAATIDPATGTDNQDAVVNTDFTNNLAVVVLDSGANPVSGVTVTFTAPNTTTAASGKFGATRTTTAVTDGTGTATTATAFTANPFAGSYSVTASISSPSLSTTFSLTNDAGTVNSVSPNSGTTPQSAIVNNDFSNALAVTVLDASSNPLGGLTVTFAAPGSGASGTFSDSTTNTTTAVTDINGVATPQTFTANSTAGGPYIVTGTTGGKTGNFSLTNTAGTVNSITANSGTTPQSAVVNNAFANDLAVTVKDSLSKPLANVTVTFTAPGSGASGTFSDSTTNTTTATTNASGVATAASFSANAFSGGPYNVTATAGTKSVNFSLTNTAGTVSTVTAVSGTTPQTAVANNDFATNLAVVVKDSGNKPLGGLTVTFTAPTTGATGTFANGTSTTTATTNINGIATASVFTANPFAGGPYTVTGATGGKSANFSLTNTAGTVNSVTATSGTPQSAAVGTAFASPFVATVLDAASKPLGGITVTFTAPPTGPTCAFSGGATTTGTTDINGTASASGCTANHQSGGPYALNASSGGKSDSFQLTNNPGAPATITPTAGTTPQVQPIGNAYTALAGSVTDAFGNTLHAGANVTLTAPSTGASVLFSNSSNTITVQTNSSGDFSATLTANSIAGSFNVAVTAGTVSQNYALTNTNFVFSPSPTGTIYIQGANSPLTANPIISLLAQPNGGTSYTGTVVLTCVNATLPSGVTCPSFTPASISFTNGAASGGSTSALALAVDPATPVGLYNSAAVAGADSSTVSVKHQATFPLAIQCTMSLQQTTPTFTPAQGGSPNQFTIGVSVLNGGSACPYGGIAVGGGVNPGDASGDGTVVTNIVSGANGTLASGGAAGTVTFELEAASDTPATGAVNVPVFDANTADAGQSNNKLVMAMPVGQEPALSVTVLTGGTVSPFAINATQAPSGTLNIPNAIVSGPATVCGVLDKNGNPDTTGNNFGITCSATASAGAINLTVVPPTTSASLRPQQRGKTLLYALGMGLPAIVFLGVGASAFAPLRRKRGINRVLCILGILLVLSMLVILPACGGGFKANFISTTSTNYTLTTMAYVTDGSNNVIGIDVFTVLLSVQ